MLTWVQTIPPGFSALCIASKKGCKHHDPLSRAAKRPAFPAHSLQQDIDTDCAQGGHLLLSPQWYPWDNRLMALWKGRLTL